jgi:DNA polymerase-3 subunit gamma/tau
VQIGGLADWEAWIHAAALAGPVGMLAQHAVPKSLQDGVLTLAVRPEHMVFCTEALRRDLEARLGTSSGHKLRLRIVHEAVAETPATHAEKNRADALAAAGRALADDPVVQAMQAQLGAEIIPESIRPAGGHA